MYLYSITILAFFLACSGTSLLLKSRMAADFLDMPNHRSLHAHPIPRIGGLVIMLSIALAWLARELIVVPLPGLSGATCWLPLLLALGLAAFSLLDDKMDLPILLRLLVHLLAATFLVLFYPLPGFAGSSFLASVMVVVLIVGVAWMTNLFNFMDGSDGLAAGVAALGFIALSIIALSVGTLPMAAFCLTVAASALGFLVFNWSPARIFMGDVGSISLGFLTGAIAVVGWVERNWPLWVPLIVFSPFWIDATVTLFRRMLRGEKFWQAHRQHYYQRLILLGWSHRQTALAYYLMMIVCAAIAYLAAGGWRLEAAFEWSGLSMLLLAAVYLLLGIGIDRRWRRHIQSAGLQV